MKTCTQCGEHKQDSEFRPRADRPGKLRPDCKRCEAKSAARRAGTPESYVCPKCGETRARWDFHIHRNGKRRSWCKFCMNKQHTDQPSTTQGVRDGRAIIEARIGAVPGGCMIPPTSMGKPPTICPWYVECKRRERGGAELLMCEVEDSALSIPLAPKSPARLPVEADGPWWFSDNK